MLPELRKLPEDVLSFYEANSRVRRSFLHVTFMITELL